MRKLRSSLVLCATICALIVLALTMSVVTYGSSLQLLSHGPVAPPNHDTNGGNIVAHGPVAPPNDDTNGGNIIAHGPVAPPNDDTNGGNIVAA
jgi:hypothetical protein